MTSAETDNRLTPDNAALLLIDHQTGLSNGVADQSLPEFKNNVVALAELGRLFKLPTVITTSAADGPNGPLLPELVHLLSEAPIIHRPGEINAWDNKDFVAAVKKTGRTHLIVAGVSTEVCVAFAVIAARRAGYEVYAVIDASGTWNKLVADVVVQRMVQAGVVPLTWVALGAELQGDWRKETGQGLARVMGEHLPFYGNTIASYMATKHV
jgi:nicotinamidase-related amidase